MFGSRTSNRTTKYEIIAEKNYRWKSTKQAFVAWDFDNQEEIELPADAVLIPLTATNSVTGSHEVDRNKATHRFNSVFSNEFTDFKEDVVKVQEKDRLDGTKTVIVEGVYTPTIKEKIADLPWASFTKNIYCLCDGEVVKLSLRASSLTPWIKFEGKIRDDNIDFMHGHGFVIGKATKEKNGSVEYYSPTYEIVKINEKDEQIANEKADEVEQAILRNKQNASGEDEAVKFAPSAPKQQESDDSITLDDIPF